MGGAAGHMKHLYENLALTPNKLKEILTNLTDGSVQVTEKLDGQNIFVTWSDKDKEIKFARNKTHIKHNGLGRIELSKEFEGRHLVYDTFMSAYDVMTLGMSQLNPAHRSKIFAEGEAWFSVEILYTDNPNIICYENNHLIFHTNGILSLNGEPPKFKLLESVIHEVDLAVRKTGWRIEVNPTFVISDKTLSFEKEFAQLIQRIADINLTPDDTLAKIVKHTISKNHLSKLHLDKRRHDELLKRIVDKTGNVNAITKGLNTHYTALIRELVRNERKICKDALSPIIQFIDNAGDLILRHVHSKFVKVHAVEASRIRECLKSAITKIQTLSDSNAQTFLTHQLNRICCPEAVNFSAEGIVFLYDGEFYKLTGSFAPVNQIIGALRYGRPGIPAQDAASKKR